MTPEADAGGQATDGTVGDPERSPWMKALVVAVMVLGVAVSGVVVPSYLFAIAFLPVIAGVDIAYAGVLSAVGGLVGAALARSERTSSPPDDEGA